MFSLAESAQAANRKAGSLRAYGITPRALLLGCVLAPALCTWSLYSEIVAQSTELAVMSLSVGVVFAILGLMALNAAFKRWLPRLALTRQELLFVYIMQTTSIAISGVGMMQFLNVGLANLFWYGSGGNGWASRYFPSLRRWAFPDPKSLRSTFRRSRRRGSESAPR